MPENLNKRRKETSPIQFLQGFLRQPRVVGSVIPSSRFLEKRLIRTTRAEKVEVAVELGPGTGGTTRAILNTMGFNTHLLCIEISPSFVKYLNKEFDDKRLLIHHGSATDLQQALHTYHLEKPDLVFSGIPFSTMPSKTGLLIVQEIKKALKPGGRFVAYQFRDKVVEFGRQVFGKPDTELELLNIPPMRFYSWTKTINDE